MATPKILSRRCGLYCRGHEVHVIQGLRYSDPEHPQVPGRLIDVSDDGIIVVEFDDGIQRYWHHDQRAFAIAASRNDNPVELQTRWSLLGTPPSRVTTRSASPTLTTIANALTRHRPARRSSCWSPLAGS